MKRIKGLHIDKILMMTSCLFVANCSRSNDEKNSNETENKNHYGQYVFLQENDVKENYATLFNDDKKPNFASYVPASVFNSQVALHFEKFGIRDVIGFQQRIIKSQNDYQYSYSWTVYFLAHILALDNAPKNIEFYNNLSSFQSGNGNICAFFEEKTKDILNEKLHNKIKKLKDSVPSGKLSISFEELKEYVRDMAYVISYLKDDKQHKDLFNVEIQIEKDADKYTLQVLKTKIEQSLHNFVIAAEEYRGKEQKELKDESAKVLYQNSFNGTCNAIPILSFRSINYKDFNDGIDHLNKHFRNDTFIKNQKTIFFNTCVVNNQEILEKLTQTLDEIKQGINHCNNAKSEEESKEEKEGLIDDAKEILISKIYLGIKYNENLNRKGSLGALEEFLIPKIKNKGAGLEVLKDTLKKQVEYKSSKVQNAIEKIFKETDNYLQDLNKKDQANNTPATLVALDGEITEMNALIDKDYEVVRLTKEGLDILEKYYTEDFVNNVNQTIRNKISERSRIGYYDYLKNIFYFLQNWGLNGTSWPTNVPDEFKNDETVNPFISSGQDANNEPAILDKPLNNCQEILYRKYADIVLPDTLDYVKAFYNETKNKFNPLFQELSTLQKFKDFVDNSSIRSIEILKLALPSKEAKEEGFDYRLDSRLPSDKEFENNDLNNVKNICKKRGNNKECPEILDMLNKTANFILNTPYNDTIQILEKNYWMDDLSKQENLPLKSSCEILSQGLNEYAKGYAVHYLGKNSFIPENIVKHINKTFKDLEVSFKTARELILPVEEKFEIKDYTDFHNKVDNIRFYLYNISRIFRDLSISIPKKLIKEEREKKDLLHASNITTKLSLVIDDYFVRKLTACAADVNSDNKHWRMIGMNDQNELHYEKEEKDSFHRSKVYKDSKGVGGESYENKFLSGESFISPFYDDISNLNNLSVYINHYHKKLYDNALLNYINEIRGHTGYSIDYSKSDFNNNIQSIAGKNFIQPIDSVKDFKNFLKETQSKFEASIPVSFEDLYKNYTFTGIEVWEGKTQLNSILSLNEKLNSRDCSLGDFLKFCKECFLFNEEQTERHYLSLCKEIFDKQWKYNTFIEKDIKNKNFQAMLENIRDTKIKELKNDFFFNDSYTSVSKLLQNNKGKQYLEHVIRNGWKDNNFLEGFCLGRKDKDFFDGIKHLEQHIIKTPNENKEYEILANILQGRQFKAEIYGEGDDKKLKTYCNSLIFLNKKEIKIGDCSSFEIQDGEWEKKINNFIKEITSLFLEDFFLKKDQYGKSINNILKTLFGIEYKDAESLKEIIKWLEENLFKIINAGKIINSTNFYEDNQWKEIVDWNETFKLLGKDIINLKIIEGYSDYTIDSSVGTIVKYIEDVKTLCNKNFNSLDGQYKTLFPETLGNNVAFDKDIVREIQKQFEIFNNGRYEIIGLNLSGLIDNIKKLGSYNKIQNEIRKKEQAIEDLKKEIKDIDKTGENPFLSQIQEKAFNAQIRQNEKSIKERTTELNRIINGNEKVFKEDINKTLKKINNHLSNLLTCVGKIDELTKKNGENKGYFEMICYIAKNEDNKETAIGGINQQVITELKKIKEDTYINTFFDKKEENDKNFWERRESYTFQKITEFLQNRFKNFGADDFKIEKLDQDGNVLNKNLNSYFCMLGVKSNILTTANKKKIDENLNKLFSYDSLAKYIK